MKGADGKPVGLVKQNDSVVFYNFRIDRPRQLSKAFVFSDFSKANISYDIDPSILMGKSIKTADSKAAKKSPVCPNKRT